MIDLLDGIELNAKLPSHEAGDRLLEGRNPIVGVAAVLRLVDLVPHYGPHALRGHLVIFANAEVEDCAVGIVGHRLPLGPLNLLKLVDLRSFSVAHSTDAVGKMALKPGVVRGGSGGSGGMSGVGGHGVKMSKRGANIGPAAPQRVPSIRPWEFPSCPCHGGCW